MEARLKESEMRDADAWIPDWTPDLVEALDQAIDRARSLAQEDEITDVSVTPVYTEHPDNTFHPAGAAQVLSGYAVMIWGGRQHSWFTVPDDRIREREKEKQERQEEDEEDEHEIPEVMVEYHADPEQAGNYVTHF